MESLDARITRLEKSARRWKLATVALGAMALNGAGSAAPSSTLRRHVFEKSDVDIQDLTEESGW